MSTCVFACPPLLDAPAPLAGVVELLPHALSSVVKITVIAVRKAIFLNVRISHQSPLIVVGQLYRCGFAAGLVVIPWKETGFNITDTGVEEHGDQHKHEHADPYGRKVEQVTFDEYHVSKSFI